MKNANRLLGFIALVAIIGFSFFGCDLSSDDTDTNTGPTIDKIEQELLSVSAISNSPFKIFLR